MRQTIAYYLLLLYATVMLKPLLPIISDAASHFFAGAYHEATVHAKYGAHHLEAEIANAGADDDAAKHQPTVKGDDPVPLHLSTNEEIVTVNDAVDQSVYPLKNHDRLPLMPLIIASPPPRFS